MNWKISRWAFFLGAASLLASCGHAPPPSKVTWTPSPANAHIEERRPVSPQNQIRRRRPLSVTAAPAAPSAGKRKTLEKPAPQKITLLATISSDYKPKDTRDLMVDTDAKGLITSIKIRNNRKNRIKTYPVEKLRSKIPLVKTAGITLVELQCLDFRPEQGCQVQIEYPYNITYASFRRFRAQLKLKDGKWGFYQGDRRFTNIHMIANKLLGLLVGIREIQLR